MKILVAQDALHAAGGVESYLAHVLPALQARGHSIGLLFTESRDSSPLVSGVNGPMVHAANRPIADIVAELRQWTPDVCFSHNMSALAIERRLLDEWSVVKFMHGYFGTCVSGLKMHRFPRPVACDRTLGPACLALYGPRRCGPLRPGAAWRGYQSARQQRRLLGRYSALVVGSRHMAEEFRRHGVSADRLTLNPLFPSIAPMAAPAHAGTAVLFLGRMTSLKGGEVLIDAVVEASRVLGRAVELVMAGDGPERATWQRQAARVRVAGEFPGWVDAAARSSALARAAVLAVPSLWPEPFGLVGLEAAVAGVPSVAFDVGGISEWLHHRVNGLLVPPSGGSRAFGAALAEVLGDTVLRARLGAAARVRAHVMSLERHVSVLDDVLERAARSPRPQPVAAP